MPASAEDIYMKQKLQAHLHNSPLAVIEFEPSYQIKIWSKEAERLFGWSADEVIGKIIPEAKWVHNDDIKGVRQIAAEMLSHRAPHSMHANRNYRKDGSVVHCEWYNSAIYDEGGQLTSILSFVLDVTGRKQAEEEMKRLSTFPEFNPNPVLELDKAGQVHYINPAAERLLPDLRILGLKHPWLQDWDEFVGKLLKSGGQSGLREIKVGDNWYQQTAYFVKDFQIIRFYGIDITARKQSEKSLQTTLQHLHATVSSMHGAVLLVGEERIELANQSFCDFFKLKETPADLIGLTPDEMLAKIKNAYLHPDEEIDRIKEIVRKGQPVLGEETLMQEGRLCLRDFVPISIDGKLYGRLWYHMDITERKRMEDALQHSKHELEDRVRERTALLEQANKELKQGIARRKLTDYTIAHQNKVLSMITLVYEESVRYESLEDFGQACLNIVESITDSEFSFIGEIGSDGLMHDIAISDTGYEACTMRDKSGHMRPPGDFKIQGLYGRVLKDGQSLIANKPSNHPDSIGVPKGHPPLRAFLGVPFCQKGRVTGMIGVGNRKYGYGNEERKLLEEITPTILESLLRKRAEVALREAQAELLKKNEELQAEIEERERTEGRLRAAQNNLRAMASEIILADEKSRKQFATELHDSVIQTLGAAKMRTHMFQDLIPKKVVTQFAEVQELLSQAIKESRQIMAELSPPVLSELGFIPAMEWLTEQFSSQNGVEIKFKARNGQSTEPLVHEVQVLLFQATRELLMNIVKHSKAKMAMVLIVQKKDTIRVTVKDDGVGFHGKVSFREDKGGFGLFSIRERLRYLGGQLIIESKPCRGTRATLVLPRGTLQ